MRRENELVSNITSWTVPGSEAHLPPSPTTLQLSMQGDVDAWKAGPSPRLYST